jgi:hypothetical protein
MKKIHDPLSVIRALLVFFMVGLLLSGLSAIPLQWEVGIIRTLFGSGSYFGQFLPSVAMWVDRVSVGVSNGYGMYPFLAYGTDWLAFGHVAIALAFIGPMRDPVRNLWVVEFGMIICLLTIPWALIFGPLRGIPLFWMLIDMSFVLVGIIPLGFARIRILKLG